MTSSMNEHLAKVGRKTSVLTGRNLQQNQERQGRPSAVTDGGVALYIINVILFLKKKH